MAGLALRPVTSADQDACGRILYDAFRDIADRHGFPADFETPEIATGLMGHLIKTSFGVVAERNGEILGSNFLTERDPVVAVGPISVAPGLQESGVGRRLMEAVIQRGAPAHGIRLVQDAFNATSMALYASLGFDVREPLVLLQGEPRTAAEEVDSSGEKKIEVRPLAEGDIDACADLCQRVHGVTRTEELRSAAQFFRPFVAIRDGRVTAYATTVELWFAAHGVAESERDLEALVLSAGEALGRPVSLLLPTRQAGLFRALLGAGMRIVKPMTLMTMGPYAEPAGAFFPSVGY